MPWTVLIWIAGLKLCCFLYIWSKNLLKIKDAVNSRGDVHLPSFFYGDLNILTNNCSWFFNSVAVLDLKMMRKKALNFYFCRASDSAFCTELLATITIYNCLTLRSAVAPLKRNSEEDHFRYHDSWHHNKIFKHKWLIISNQALRHHLKIVHFQLLKTLDILIKCLAMPSYAKKSTSNCYSGKTLYMKLFASNKQKHRGSYRSNIILLAKTRERLLILKMQTCLNIAVSHGMRNKELIDAFLLMC